MQLRPLFSFLGSLMQNRPRLILSLTAWAGSALLAGGAMAQQADDSAQGAEVVIDITNLRNDKGVIRACMTDDPDRFPRCRDDANSHRLVIPAEGAAQLHFRNVAPGTYAIALLHDENDNGRADRALSMIPREGFGFSRDAKVRLGPPDFDDAAIEIGTSDQRHAIRMRYML